MRRETSLKIGPPSRANGPGGTCNGPAVRRVPLWTSGWGLDFGGHIITLCLPVLMLQPPVRDHSAFEWDFDALWLITSIMGSGEGSDGTERAVSRADKGKLRQGTDVYPATSPIHRYGTTMAGTAPVGCVHIARQNLGELVAPPDSFYLVKQEVSARGHYMVTKSTFCSTSRPQSVRTVAKPAAPCDGCPLKVTPKGPMWAMRCGAWLIYAACLAAFAVLLLFQSKQVGAWGGIPQADVSESCVVCMCSLAELVQSDGARGTYLALDPLGRPRNTLNASPPTLNG